MYKILYYLLFKNLPNTLGGNLLRSFAAKKMFHKSAKDILVRKGALIGSGRNVTIGRNSRIGANCRMMIQEGLFIGDNVEMGPDVVFIDINHKFYRSESPIVEQGHLPAKPIYIEDDVWIGARSIILPGVKLAKGTVVGAGSVVTKSSPEYSIIAGNPAKVIGFREYEEHS